MRNLKRALSLTLASVMLLGMMVIGSSAAQGYDDVAETDNVEAIEVLQAIEVMVGDERGFGPDRPVNRAEMAVVMALLLNLDYNYYVSTCPFGDVYDWARGPVGACYANGIVSGRGDGVYDPGATVTAVEAASMLMRALGYFRYQNDYEGNFQLSTVKQGSKIGLFDNVGSSATEPMTRNQVAQMVLNALQTGMAEPDGNTINLTTPDGSVFTGKVNYVNVTSNKDFARAISDVRASSMGSTNDSPIVELGEQLYDGKLKLNSNTTDVFGRPARKWEFDGKAIGTYAKKELLQKEYTAKVTGRDLYDEIGSATLNDKDYDVFIYIDGQTEKDVLGTAYFARGDMNKNNKDGVGATGNGVLTQVFVDGNRKEVTVAIINTYLARANADYSEKKDNVTFTVYKIDDVKNSKTAPVYVKTAGKDENITVTSEDFDIKDIKDGDAYRVNIADGEIQVLEQAEIIGDSTLTAFSKKDYVISDGTQYDYANAIQYDPEVLEEWTQTVVNLKDRRYNLYMDAYGYVLGIDLVEDPDNYVFITGVDSNTSNLASTNFKANAIFLDGTMEVIEINGKKSTFNSAEWEAPLVNRWFTYTVNNTTNIYSVDEVNDEIGKTTVAVGSVVDSHPNKKLAQFASEDVITNLLVASGNINDAVYDVTAEHDIDVKHVSLPGTGANIYNAQKVFNKVYGNDDSVYITAEVETINPTNTKDGDHVGVISDVINVTTGVDKANIKTFDLERAKDEADDNGKYAQGTARRAAYGAYTLYKDNGYIVASVVVGEDNAAAKNLVYVHTDDVEEERYVNADDEWTWTRKVVYNGEETEIREVGDKLTYLDKMKEYNWYQVKFNANNEVIGVELAEHALNPTTADTDGDEYVTRTDWIEAAINEKNTVLYEESLYDGYTKPNDLKNFKAKWNTPYVNKTTGGYVWNEVNDPNLPKLEGHTFFVRTTDKTGFVVNDDVKTVFIQRRDNKLETYFEDNYKDLEDILDDLNYDNVDSLGYRFEISAILENGRATVVVIHDLNGDNYKPSESPDHHTVTARYDSRKTFDVTISDSCTPTNVETAAAIRYELETNFNARDVKVNFKGNKVVSVSWTAPGGEVVTLSVDNSSLTVNYFRHVTVDGTKVKIGNSTTWEELLSGSKTDFSKYPVIKITGTNDVVNWYKLSDIRTGQVDTDVGEPDSVTYTGWSTGDPKTDWIAVETGYMVAGINEAAARAAIEEAAQNTRAPGATGGDGTGFDGKLKPDSGLKGAPDTIDCTDVQGAKIKVTGTFVAGDSNNHTWGSGSSWGFSDTDYNDATHFLVPFVFQIPEGARWMERTGPDSKFYDYNGKTQDIMGFMAAAEDIGEVAECKVNWYADDGDGNKVLMGSTTFQIDLTGVNGGTGVGTTGTIGGNVVSGQESKLTDAGNTETTKVHALEPNKAYIFSDTTTAAQVLNSDKSGDIHGQMSDNIFFRFNVDREVEDVILTITSSNGAVVYTEEAGSGFTPTEAKPVGKGSFYVQVKGAAPLVNAGDGAMKTRPLPAGTYTWTVTGINDSGEFTLAGGSFSVNAATGG